MYHLYYKDLKLFCANLCYSKDFRNTVHGQQVRKDQESFLIRNVYARPVSQWNHYDKDIQAPGTWIAWDMADAKLHRPKPSIPVTATSEARDVSGAAETEEGHGRKKGRHPETYAIHIRKQRQSRGQSYSTRKR